MYAVSESVHMRRLTYTFVARQWEKYQNLMCFPNYFVFLSSSRFHNEEKTRKYYLRLRDRIKSKVIPLLKVYDRKSLHVTNRHCISSEQTAHKKKVLNARATHLQFHQSIRCSLTLWEVDEGPEHKLTICPTVITRTLPGK